MVKRISHQSSELTVQVRFLVGALEINTGDMLLWCNADMV